MNHTRVRYVNQEAVTQKGNIPLGRQVPRPCPRRCDRQRSPAINQPGAAPAPLIICGNLSLLGPSHCFMAEGLFYYLLDIVSSQTQQILKSSKKKVSLQLSTQWAALVTDDGVLVHPVRLLTIPLKVTYRCYFSILKSEDSRLVFEFVEPSARQHQIPFSLRSGVLRGISTRLRFSGKIHHFLQLRSAYPHSSRPYWKRTLIPCFNYCDRTGVQSNDSTCWHHQVPRL